MKPPFPTQVVKHFTDATQQGDRDASWLAEGEVRKCLNASLSCRPLAPRDDAGSADRSARSGPGTVEEEPSCAAARSSAADLIDATSPSTASSPSGAYGAERSGRGSGDEGL